MLKFIPIREMTESDIRDYESALCALKPRSCEFAYANLFSWQDAYNTRFAKTPEMFAVSFEIDGEISFLPPVGKDVSYGDFYSETMEYARSLGARKIGFGGFSVEQARRIEKCAGKEFMNPDRGNFDYIYEVSPLETYSGKKLHAKRNHVNKFLSLYGERWSFENMTADSALECIEFNREWKKLNERYEDAELSSEEKSAVIMLKNFEKLKLCGGILRVDGKICGCTVGEPTYPASDTFVVHTEKALYDIVGAYPMLFSRFLISLGGKYKYVNREDDVGDEGLRKSKLSYNPVFLEEKYSGFTEVVL